MDKLAVKDNRLYAIIMNYDMQSKFFKNVLDSISDEDSHNRLNTNANHIAWLAGSLVEQRFETANILNPNNILQQEAHEMFKDNQGIKEGLTYPSLEQYNREWDKITPVLRKLLLNAEAEKAETTIEFPGMSMTILEFLAFGIYREANHIGQLALWRRLLGYEPMKYM